MNLPRLQSLPSLLIAAALVASPSIAQNPPSTTSNTHDVHLQIVVTGKPGTPPVGGLQPSQFSFTDNNHPVQPTEFKAFGKGQEPAEIILVLDAVNTRFTTVAFAEDQLRKFLRTSPLPTPATLAVLTDKGVQIQKSYTADGNALDKELQGYTPGLREITRAAGFWGADERLGTSLKAMEQLASYAGTLPGRKLVIWISPGWPLLSGPGVDLGRKQQDSLFAQIVALSTRLRTAGVTVYQVNPLGPGENLLQADYYQTFVKGVSKPGDVALGELGLQVIAVQTGGLALQSSSDVAGMLSRCVSDLDHWYEVTIPAEPAEQQGQFHTLQVKVDQPGLNARTRTGYYPQP